MTEHITNGEVPLTEVEQIQIEKVLAIVRKLSRQQQEVILEGMRQLREEQEVSKKANSRSHDLDIPHHSLMEECMVLTALHWSQNCLHALEMY